MNGTWLRFQDLSRKDQQRLRRFLSSMDEEDYLISWMEDHLLIARKQITALGLQGKDTYNRKWAELSQDLNIIANKEKSIDQWQRKWTRMRLNAKQEMTNYLKSLQQTGNNYFTKPTEACVRISNIFGQYGTCLPVLPELGLTSTLKVNEDTEDEFVTKFFQDLQKQTKNIQLERYQNCKIDGLFAYLPWDLGRRNSKQSQIFADNLLVESRWHMAFGGDMKDPFWNTLTIKLNGSKTFGSEERTTENFQQSWKYMKFQARSKCQAFLDGNPGRRNPDPIDWRIFREHQAYVRTLEREDEYQPEVSGPGPAFKREDPWDSPIETKKMKRENSYEERAGFSAKAFCRPPLQDQYNVSVRPKRYASELEDIVDISSEFEDGFEGGRVPAPTRRSTGNIPVSRKFPDVKPRLSDVGRNQYEASTSSSKGAPRYTLSERRSFNNPRCYEAEGRTFESYGARPRPSTNYQDYEEANFNSPKQASGHFSGYDRKTTNETENIEPHKYSFMHKNKSELSEIFETFSVSSGDFEEVNERDKALPYKRNYLTQKNTIKYSPRELQNESRSSYTPGISVKKEKMKTPEARRTQYDGASTSALIHTGQNVEPSDVINEPATGEPLEEWDLSQFPIFDSSCNQALAALADNADAVASQKKELEDFVQQKIQEVLETTLAEKLQTIVQEKVQEYLHDFKQNSQQDQENSEEM